MRRALLLALLLAAGPARAENVIVSLSTSRVLISSNYTGASIAVFGAVERDAQTVARSGPYQAVVTVRGPRETVIVRQKQQVGPIWVNRAERRFLSAPTFLAVLSSAPFSEVTTEPLRQRLRVGLEAIVAAPGFAFSQHQPGDEPFRAALLRIERREGLYFENERGVAFLTPNIFQANLPLPATASPGYYEVEVAVFADHVLLSRSFTDFEVVKSGFEQQVAVLARDWSVFYGAGAAGVALLFGWLASIVFRRD
jgi:uncharacterized protein (TIGR02186 family)